MVYKVKDTLNPKSNTGFRCDQAGKNKIIELLNEIENNVNYAPKVTKDSALELCVRQELTLRYFEKNRSADEPHWFLETENAIINEFEKKEKKK